MAAEALGAFIKERRKLLGLSQRELATRAHLSHSYVANLERGFDYSTGRPNKPSAERLAQLARALGVKPEVLLKLALAANAPEPASGTVEAAPYPITDGEKALLLMAEQEGVYVKAFGLPTFWQRPPQERRRAFRYLEGLLEESRALEPLRESANSPGSEP